MKQQPRITVLRKGPLRLSGVGRVVWQIPVVSADGVPIAWREGATVIEPADDVLLCRCGQSNNKPFCDDSHLSVGFDAEDLADTGPRAERATTFGGGPIELTEDPPLCAHTGFCGNKGTNVWKLASAPTPTTAETVQATAMAQHCPSGTLSITINGEALEPTLPREVAVLPNGPIWVTGGIEIERSDGQPLERRSRVTLCRCGASANMPLCDGAHESVGFEHSP